MKLILAVRQMGRLSVDVVFFGSKKGVNRLNAPIPLPMTQILTV